MQYVQSLPCTLLAEATCHCEVTRTRLRREKNKKRNPQAQKESLVHMSRTDIEGLSFSYLPCDGIERSSIVDVLYKPHPLHSDAFRLFRSWLVEAALLWGVASPNILNEAILFGGLASTSFFWAKKCICEMSITHCCKKISHRPQLLELSITK